jgi:hypothetical protein
MVPKTQGKDPEKWRQTRWIPMDPSEVKTLIVERYGEAMSDYLYEQLARGHVIETAWGYLRQEPAKGDV